MNIDKRLRRALARLDVPPGSRCLVALSGGSDSVALLLAVVEASEHHALKIAAARVSHGLRADSAEQSERDLCCRLCAGLGVSFTSLPVVKGEIEALAKLSGRGIEQAAREARHGLLEEHRRRTGADFLFFGHTADDQIETLFMRIVAGAGPEGLSGIPERRGRILRPLLWESRESLRAWLDGRGVRWAEDETNLNSDYRRNRFRRELLPLIDDIVPGWSSALRVLSTRSAEACMALDDSLGKDLPGQRVDDSVSWSQAQWKSAGRYIRALALLRGMNSIDDSGVPDRRIPWSSVAAARDALEGGKSWSAHGFTLAERDARIVLARRAEIPGRARVLLRRQDVLAESVMNIGPFRVTVGPESDETAHAYMPNPEDWPLTVEFGGDGDSLRVISSASKKSITEKSFGRWSDDFGAKMLYIRIRTEKEGYYVQETGR